MNLVRDVRFGTYKLFGAPDYAVIWSTQEYTPTGDRRFFQREVPFRTALNDLARTANNGVIVLAAFSLLLVPRWTRSFAWLVVPLAVSSWALRTIIYWAMPRYAYFITA